MKLKYTFCRSNIPGSVNPPLNKENDIRKYKIVVIIIGDIIDL